MGAPYHSADEKIEDAVAAVLASELATTGLTVGLGMEAVDVAFPFCGIVCAKSEPHERSIETPTGNVDCEVVVSVMTDLHQTTRAQHAAYVAAVRDVLYASNLTELLNAAGVADLTVYRSFPGQTTRAIDQDARRTDCTLLVWCAPS